MHQRRSFPASRSRWTAALQTPERLFVASFALLIAVGTAGLRLVPAFTVGPPLGWLDAWFTMTSAVCVTGLVVVDTATRFTPLGQAWILVFIQLGGLGMIVFASFVIAALGARPSLRHQAAASASATGAFHLDYRSLTRSVVGFTFAFEGLGAALLLLAWGPRLGWAEAVWPAVFHSVSAFCNAGFSTFTDNLAGSHGEPFVLLVVAALIVVGGIGFLTMADLRANQWGRGHLLRLTLNTRLVTITTAVLIVLGWVGFAVFEWHASLGAMPMLERVVNALFMSVTARTAGFNTVDYAQTTDAGAFLTVLLMAVGGSPGSTAGGLKTTTIAVLVLLAWSRWRGRGVVRAGSRSVPEETVQRAVGLFVMVAAAVTAGVFGLTISEEGLAAPIAVQRGFLAVVFEVVSAFGTVGLTMNLTPSLSGAGRLSVILLMFLGRVGPLAFASAIARRAAGAVSKLRYAFEEVVIG